MFQEIRSQIQNHSDITNDEALWLFEQEDEKSLREIYALANQINEELNHGVVSYIHNMNFNYTNLCELYCTFCAFRRDGDEADAYIRTEEDILRAIEGKGISEITFQGGLTEKVKLEEALNLLRAVKRERPDIHLHAFSPEEIDYYSRTTGRTRREVIREAHEAGMDSMCGTAAEILDDEIRKKICPTKIKADDWIDIIRTAHEMGIHSTSTIMFGHIEKPKHWVNHLNRLRELQKETRMITEFIPLLFMPDNANLGKLMSRQGITQNREKLQFKMLTVGRIYFQNWIRNVQTSWVKLGLDCALRSLSIGANDLSGTLYSESITRDAGGRNGEYVSLEQFEQAVRSVGKIPQERDTLYSFQRSAGSVQRTGNDFSERCTLNALR